MNKEITQTENFIVFAVEKPHVSREDGGHIMIVPKVKISDRTELEPKLAVEVIRLTMIVGEAMTTAMNSRGVDIGRINYQDNGNWSVFKPEGPYFHIHLYGRAKSAKINKWGDACFFPQRSTGFYDNFIPFNEDDIEEIRKEIKVIMEKDKYQDQEWHL
ncbi:MAG: HIT family protein [Patescibacteria group bacterium]